MPYRRALSLTDTRAFFELDGRGGKQGGHILERGFEEDDEEGEARPFFLDSFLTDFLEHLEEALVRGTGAAGLGFAFFFIVGVCFFEQVIQYDLEGAGFFQVVLSFFRDLQHAIFFDIFFQEVFQQ